MYIYIYIYIYTFLIRLRVDPAPSIVQPITVDPAAEKEKEAARAAAKAKVVANKFSKLPAFKLRLLSGEWPDLLKKQKQKGRYDVLYVASHAAHLIADERVNSNIRLPYTAIYIYLSICICIYMTCFASKNKRGATTCCTWRRTLRI